METSLFVLLSSNTFFVLVTCALVTVLVYFATKDQRFGQRKSLNGLKRLPGPRPLSFIGNLMSLSGSDLPCKAFEGVAQKYGPVVGLRLGTIPAVICTGIDSIKEVLLTKSAQFDNRPDFHRFNVMFNGNKNQSLELADYTDVQRMRRDMLKNHTLPRNFSIRHLELDTIIRSQAQTLIDDIRAKRTTPDAPIEIKPIFVENCANIFTRYFFSRRFSSDDPMFRRYMKNFDLVFWEVNQIYALDFLPFLIPFQRKYFNKMEKNSHEIREFILEKIVEDRRERWSENDDRCQYDFVESLIDHIKRDHEPTIDWETAFYALEDLSGGHAATGCFLSRILNYISESPEAQQKIHQEIDKVVANKPNANSDVIELADRHQMPYTEAVCWEALRLIVSPLFPRVANQDSSIGGYFVEKGTLVLFNNYDLCMSSELWDEPTKFKPERFIQGGHVVKPAHFLPFGAGRRGCLGYKIIQIISFSLLANCMKNFSIRIPANVKNEATVGLLPLPDNSIKLIFSERNKSDM